MVSYNKGGGDKEFNIILGYREFQTSLGYMRP